MAISELTIILVSGLVACMILATIGCTFIMIIRALKGGKSNRSGRSEMEETRLIQEIHNGMTRMEQRVEALETLLIDEERTKRKRERFEQELSGD